MRYVKYTEAELCQAVASSKSYRQACIKLGIAPKGGNYEVLRRRVTELSLDVRHFATNPTREIAVQRRLFDHRLVTSSARHSFSAEDVEVAVAASYSMAEACRKLGHSASGTVGRQVLARWIDDLHLDTSHFTGPGWAKGMTFPKAEKVTLVDLLVTGGYLHSTRLKQRLIDEGLKEPCCESCGQSSWLDRPIPLELHHEDGDRSNNRLENLKLLCPNCHALTDNYRARNIGSKV